MKKPLLLNVISIVLIIFGALSVGLALFALATFSKENLPQNYDPAFYIKNIFYVIIIGILFFTSGILLFKGRELGRKIFAGAVVLMAVYVLLTQGFRGLQGLGIPILIVIFLYQYWGIKDYFAQVGENKLENEPKSNNKVKSKKNK